MMEQTKLKFAFLSLLRMLSVYIDYLQESWSHNRQQETVIYKIYKLLSYQYMSYL